jgi:hypothetical protein
VQITIVIVVIGEHWFGERVKPADTELTEHKFETVKNVTFSIAGSMTFFFLKRFDSGLVVVNALHLNDKHDHREDGKQQRFEQQANNQDDCPGRHLRSERTVNGGIDDDRTAEQRLCFTFCRERVRKVNQVSVSLCGLQGEVTMLNCSNRS